MKTTTTSIIILIVIILLLSVNSIALNRISDTLLEELDRLGDNPIYAVARTKQLESHWKALEPFLSISLTHAKVENVTSAVSKLRIYAEFGDTVEFSVAKEAFRNAVDNIRFSGGLTLETIL